MFRTALHSLYEVHQNTSMLRSDPDADGSLSWCDKLLLVMQRELFTSAPHYILSEVSVIIFYKVLKLAENVLTLK